MNREECEELDKKEEHKIKVFGLIWDTFFLVWTLYFMISGSREIGMLSNEIDPSWYIYFVIGCVLVQATCAYLFARRCIQNILGHI